MGDKSLGMHPVSQSLYYCSESGDCFLSVDNHRGSCKIQGDAVKPCMIFELGKKENFSPSQVCRYSPSFWFMYQ